MLILFAVHIQTLHFDRAVYMVWVYAFVLSFVPFKILNLQ